MFALRCLQFELLAQLVHNRLVLLHKRLVPVHNRLVLVHRRLVPLHTRLVLLHTRLVAVHNRLVLAHTGTLDSNIAIRPSIAPVRLSLTDCSY